MSYDEELAGLRDALDQPTTGAAQAGELARLHTLISRYPDEAAEMLAQVRGAT